MIKKIIIVLCMFCLFGCQQKTEKNKTTQNKLTINDSKIKIANGDISNCEIINVQDKSNEFYNLFSTTSYICFLNKNGKYLFLNKPVNLYIVYYENNEYKLKHIGFSNSEIDQLVEMSFETNKIKINNNVHELESEKPIVLAATFSNNTTILRLYKEA